MGDGVGGRVGCTWSGMRTSWGQPLGVATKLVKSGGTNDDHIWLRLNQMNNLKLAKSVSYIVIIRYYYITVNTQ